MFKLITVFLRRQDLSRAQFRAYYEGHHMPMALQHVHRFGFSKYLRNHVVGEAGAPPGFDCLTEFYFESPERAAASQGFMATPEGKVFADDELNFLDMGYHPSVPVIEQVLSGPPRVVDPVPTYKKMLVVKHGASRSADAVRKEAEQFGRELAQRNGALLQRVTLDLPLPDMPGAPFDAVITLWPAQPNAFAQCGPLHWHNDSDWHTLLDIEALEATPAQLGVR
jgi:uncharacterized protein (TIGR02118 family)